MIDSRTVIYNADDVVHLLYESTLDGTKWPEILRALTSIFGAKVAMLATYDFARKRVQGSCTVGVPPVFQRSSAKYAAINPWANESLLGASGVVRTGRQLIDDDALRRTRFYNEWLLPQRLFHSMRGILEYRDRQIWFVELIREGVKPNFDDLQLMQFASIIAHAQRVFQISQSQNNHIDLANASISAFDHVPFGVVIIDAAGAILAANRRAGKFSLERDGIAFGSDGIVAASRPAKKQLLDIVASRRAPGHSASDDAHISIPRSDGMRPLSILVSPTPKTIGPFGSRHSVAVILISDPDDRIVINPDSLRDIYKLTAAEARLTAVFAEGLPLKEVAQRLNITYETARTYLKRTYGKTNTSRQAELIRLVHAGVSNIDTR